MLKWTALTLSLLVLASCAAEEPSTQAFDLSCRLNSDCAIGEVCSEGACVPDDAACQGEDCPCLTNGDCTSGQACNLETGACFEMQCLRDGDCALGEVCSGSLCLTDVNADRDRDGVPDTEDLCPDLQNADQEDADADGVGDACDADDDNDGVPDTVDNCPTEANPSQADANQDGVGNACDAEVSGVSVTGQIDASLGGGADPSRASVTITGRGEPAAVDTEGRFTFSEALPDGGRFTLRVSLQGFLPFIDEFSSPTDQPSFDAGVLTLIPESSDSPANLSGEVNLSGAQDHSGVTVTASVEGVPVATTVTDPEGTFALPASRVDHTLSFARQGFLSTSIETVWDGDEGRFEVGAQPLADFDGITLQPDQSAGLEGRLVSPIPGFDFNLANIDVHLRGSGDTRFDANVTNDRFQFDALQPGTYGLEIDVAGHISVSSVVFVESEESLDLGEIHLSEEASDENLAAGLTGSALIADREDSSGVLVRLLHNGQPVATTVTDSQGRYGFIVSRLDYSIEFQKEGYVSQTLNNIIFDEDIDAFTLNGEPLSERTTTLERVLGQIEVSVSVAPDWIPAQQRTVRVRLVGEGIDRTEEQVSQSTAFTDIPSGTYVVYAERQGFSLSQQIVVLGELSNQIQVQLTVELNNLGGAGLDLRGVTVRDAELRALNSLIGADLSGVRIVGQNTENPNDETLPASLCDLNLNGARLVGTVLTGASLNGTSLVGADLSNASLAGASMVSADLSGADFFGANMEAVTFYAENYECTRENQVSSPTIMEGADFSSADLSGAIFSPETPPEGRVCSGRVDNALDLSSATFSQTNLSRALMPGVNLAGSDLSSALLQETDLRKACLEDAGLILTNLRGADLSNAGLARSSMLGSILLGTTLVGADLSSADLSGANLRGANLDNVNANSAFMSAIVTGDTSMKSATLNSATFIGVIFASVDLSQSSFDNADLRNTQFVNCTFEENSFVAANMANTSMTNAFNPDADFTGAQLVGSNLNRSDLSGSNLTDANLNSAFINDADLRGSDLTDASMNGAALQRADLTGSIFNGASFSGADLSRADLSQCNLGGLDFTGATLFGADLGLANFDGADLTGSTLSAANAVSASFKSADINSAEMVGINLSSTNLSGSDMLSANLTGANLDSSNLVGVRTLPPARLLFNFRPTILSNINFNNTICPDGTHSDSDCESARSFTAPPAENASRFFFGSLNTQTPTWSRPGSNCQTPTNSGYLYEAHVIHNDSVTPVSVVVEANWTGGDGFLHAFAVPFDISGDDSSCIVGNDDFDGQSKSKLPTALTIGAREFLVIVASTFSPGDNIDTYNISVTESVRDRD